MKSGSVVVCFIVFILILIPVVAWVGGSAITSAIKTGADNCGTTYPVEVVFAGNWFCPENTQETECSGARC